MGRRYWKFENANEPAHTQKIFTIVKFNPKFVNERSIALLKLHLWYYMPVCSNDNAYPPFQLMIWTAKGVEQCSHKVQCIYVKAMIIILTESPSTDSMELLLFSSFFEGLRNKLESGKRFILGWCYLSR